MSAFMLTELCPHCEWEISVRYKGFKIHTCPKCKKAIKPCSQCEVYTHEDGNCNDCPLRKKK